jgi:hypothetical protein
LRDEGSGAANGLPNSSRPGVQMKLATIKKTSVDNFREQIDYTEWLAEGEDLSEWEFESDPTGIVVTAADGADGILVFFAAGGEDATAYNLKVTVTTNEGQVRMDYITYTVGDP